jgi:hypothetical protein
VISFIQPHPRALLGHRRQTVCATGKTPRQKQFLNSTKSDEIPQIFQQVKFVHQSESNIIIYTINIINRLTCSPQHTLWICHTKCNIYRWKTIWFYDESFELTTADVAAAGSWLDATAAAAAAAVISSSLGSAEGMKLGKGAGGPWTPETGGIMGRPGNERRGIRKCVFEGVPQGSIINTGASVVHYLCKWSPKVPGTLQRNHPVRGWHDHLHSR